MTKYCGVALLLVATASFASEAEGDALWREFRALATTSKEMNTREAEQIPMTYLASLTKPQFFDLMRAYARDPKYATSDETAIGMMFFYGIYLTKGAGKAEPFFVTLKEVSDPDQPASCRIGLLGALNIHLRQDMSTSDTQSMVSQVLQMSLHAGNPESFRTVCIDILGEFLFRRLALISRNAPEIVDSLKREDIADLHDGAQSNASNENVRKAAELLGYIGDYRAAIKSAQQEIKEDRHAEWVKAQTERWQPGSAYLALAFANTTGTVTTTQTLSSK